MDMPVPKPQAEHLWLQKLFGEWTFEGEASMGPDEPPHKMSGTETVTMLGGLWMLGEGKGKMPDGTEAITLMTLGFDPARGRFVGSFIGSMMTHFWIYDGKLDAGKNELPLIAEGPNMAPGGSGMVDYRDTITFLSDDHRTLSAAIKGDDGSWQHFMTTHYRRTR